MSDPSLSQPLLTLLVTLVDADERSQKLRGTRDVFLLQRTADGYVMMHAGWDDSQPLPDPYDIDELIDAGYLREEFGRHGDLSRKFAVTGRGRQAVDRARRRVAASPAEAVSLDWPLMRPVLQACVRAYEKAGAPKDGVSVDEVSSEIPLESEPLVARLRALIDADLVAAVAEVDQALLYVKPTPAGLQEIRDWPPATPEQIVATIVAALSDAAAEADRPVEDQRLLRSASEVVGGLARDLVIGVVANAIVNQ